MQPDFSARDVSTTCVRVNIAQDPRSDWSAQMNSAGRTQKGWLSSNQTIVYMSTPHSATPSLSIVFYKQYSSTKKKIN